MAALKANVQDSNHFHVLAVDDSLLDRKLLERILTISSCRVTCVESGNKALEYLGLPDGMDASSHACPITQQRVVDVDLIITDYSMPGWAAMIYSRESRCLEGGAEEFLLKPVQLSDMKKLQPHLNISLYSSCNNTSSTDDHNDDHNEGGGHNHNDNHDQTRKRRKHCLLSPQTKDPNIEVLPNVKCIHEK